MNLCGWKFRVFFFDWKLARLAVSFHELNGTIATMTKCHWLWKGWTERPGLLYEGLIDRVYPRLMIMPELFLGHLCRHLSP